MHDIVAIAKSYVGQKEKPNNSGFWNLRTEEEMKKVGWHKGDSWCCFAAEMIWKQAYADHPDVLAVIKELFSGLSTATFANFKRHEEQLKALGKEPFFHVSDTPVPGAVVIFKHGDGPSGHTGVVVDIAPRSKLFATVEGNTNTNGSANGDGFYLKTRKLDFTDKPGQLNLVGFILPYQPKGT